MNEKKILLLMCHWIGDTFWAMQVIPELRKKFPSAELWAGIKPWSKDLFYGLIDDDKIITLKNVTSDRHREKFSLTGYAKELKTIRNEHFDTIIDFTCNRYSALFGWLGGIKNRIGLKQHRFSFFYTLKGESFPEDQHLSLKPWETVKLIINDAKLPGYFFSPISPVLKESLEKHIGFKLEGKIALLMPGAGWKEKEWGIDNFAQCGQFLLKNGYSLIIGGSEKERGLCSELNLKFDNKAYIFIENLKDFIALLPYISIAITNDSGTAHLSASANVNTVTLFMFDNHDQYRPIGRNVKIVKKNDTNIENVINLISEIIKE